MDLPDLVHARRRMTAARLLRSPALHFAAIGALLFAVQTARERVAPAPIERPPIVVRAEQIEALVARHERSAGHSLSGDDVRALVEGEIEEELLFREGVALGLAEDDDGIRWRLVEKMTFLSDHHDDPSRPELLDQALGLALGDDDPIVRRIVIEKMRIALRHAASAQEPTDAELEAWMQRHRDRFEQPGRTKLSHVVVTRERRGDAVAADAAALAEELRRDRTDPAKAVLRSDPFALPTHAVSLADGEVAARFGPAFAQAVAKLPAGVWSDPVASPFGLHVVLVHERTTPQMPPLGAVRNQVLLGWMAERRAEALRSGVARLRATWDVRIEWPAGFATALVGSSS